MIEIRTKAILRGAEGYDLMPRLEVDVEEVARQLEALDKLPAIADLKIIVEIEQGENNKMYGYPVKFRMSPSRNG